MLAFTVSSVSAQQASTIRGQHKVKKKETIFGISREYGLTIEELIKANPEMNEPGYELKKGMILNIPFSKDSLEARAKREAAAKQVTVVKTAPVVADDVKNREIRRSRAYPSTYMPGTRLRTVIYIRY